MRYLQSYCTVLAATCALCAAMSASAFALPTLLPETVTSWSGKNIGETEVIRADGDAYRCSGLTQEDTVDTNRHLGAFHLRLTGCGEPGGLKTICTGLGEASGVILALGSWHLVYDTLRASLSEAGVAILYLYDNVHFTCNNGFTLGVVSAGGMLLCLILNPAALTKAFEFHCNKASGASRPEETKYYNESGTLVSISPLLLAENEGTAEDSVEIRLGTIESAEAVLLMI